MRDDNQRLNTQFNSNRNMSNSWEAAYKKLAFNSYTKLAGNLGRWEKRLAYGTGEKKPGGKYRWGVRKGGECYLARRWRDNRLGQKNGQEGPLNERGGELSIYTFMVSRNIEFRDTLITR